MRGNIWANFIRSEEYFRNINATTTDLDLWNIFFYSEIFNTSFSLLHAFDENKYIFKNLSGQV